MDNATITSSPTFCSAPWDSLNIDQTGRVSSCMHMHEEIGNIKETNLKEILTGRKITAIKQAMAHGEWHSACNWCKELEVTTGNSGRTVRQCSVETKQAIDNDINYFEPHHLVVNWSNLCNLTCVYCNPETSTAWQSVKKIPINFVRNDQQALIEIMKEKGKTLEGLTLGGGEPLLQKGLAEMLRSLDSQRVNVMVTTNLSVDILTNDVYQELKTWPNVTWMVSFDNASRDKFEYVRHGALWATLIDNIAVMKQDRQKIIAHPAYSIYNAYELVPYYEFCTQHDLDIFWCELTNPWDLDARRLPLSLRKLAIKEIDRVVECWGSKTNLGINTLLNYRKQLEDNSYIFNIDTYLKPWSVPKYNVLEWHRNIESTLHKSTMFVDLWPELAQRIQNEK